MILVLSPRARSDLEDIWLIVAQGSGPEAADRWLDRVHDRCRGLLTDPLSGRDRSELVPEIRSVVVRPWVVFYRVSEARVEVVRVLHGRRDLAAIL